MYELKLALAKLRKVGNKVNIVVVANEANVSAALIHKRYPEIAKEIRMLDGKTTRLQRDEKHDLLMVERDKNRVLRKENADLLQEIINLARVTESFRSELLLQKSIASTKVVKIES